MKHCNATKCLSLFLLYSKSFSKSSVFKELLFAYLFESNSIWDGFMEFISPILFYPLVLQPSGPEAAVCFFAFALRCTFVQETQVSVWQKRVVFHSFGLQGAPVGPEKERGIEFVTPRHLWILDLAVMSRASQSFEPFGDDDAYDDPWCWSQWIDESRVNGDGWVDLSWSFFKPRH